MRVFFFDKEKLFFSALKLKFLDEIKQSNGLKPQKSFVFKIFVSVFLTKEICVGKCLKKLFIPFT